MSFFSISINIIIAQSLPLDPVADVSERTPRWPRRVCCEGSVKLFLFSGVRPDFWCWLKAQKLRTGFLYSWQHGIYFVVVWNFIYNYFSSRAMSMPCFIYLFFIIACKFGYVIIINNRYIFEWKNNYWHTKVRLYSKVRREKCQSFIQPYIWFQ